MKKPSRKDLRRLNVISNMADKLQSAYLGLSSETKEFLLSNFEGETEIHLRQFETNVSETIGILKCKADVRN